MRDDPKAIKLRRKHAEWMKLTSEAEETLARAERLFGRGLFSRWFRRIVRAVHRKEELARLRARETYEP